MSVAFRGVPGSAERSRHPAKGCPFAERKATKCPRPETNAMSSKQIDPQLETSRTAHAAALAAAMIFPTFSTWLYFLALSESAVVQPVYALSKFVAVRVSDSVGFLVQRRRIGWRRPQVGELALGALVGCLMVAAGLAAYELLFRDSPWLARARSKSVTSSTIWAFLSRGAIGALPRSSHCRTQRSKNTTGAGFALASYGRVASQWPAIGVASLAFMSHHVLVLHRFLAAGWLPTGVFARCAWRFGGAVWCWMYVRRGSIYGPWIAHVLVDAGIMWIGSDLAWG